MFDMIGEVVAKLHNAGIMHGDLSLTNILTDARGPTTMKDLFVVGFHLATKSADIDDKAVDLKLFCRIY